MSSARSIDVRWGQHVPWFLRYSTAPVVGNFDLCFSRIAQRMQRLADYNEAGIANLDHFGAVLESDSLQRFQHRQGAALGPQLNNFFAPSTIQNEADTRAKKDPEEERVSNAFMAHLFSGGNSAEVSEAHASSEKTRDLRIKGHHQVLLHERLMVLETLLLAVYRQGDSARAALQRLTQDVRRAFAESRVPLDVRGDPPELVPLDERLLQQEVVDPLLTRLQARWPIRARELLDAYHDLLLGRKLDEVFSNAFKTLEEIGRSLSGDPQFDFSQEQLRRHFGRLHPTIVQTMLKLRAHRGDEAAHGRQAPDPCEVRYLLFQICNIALLLLDYIEVKPEANRAP